MNTKFIDIKRSKDELILKVGLLIKTRRNEIGISQEMLGEMSGIGRDYISKLENGRKPGFTFGLIAKVFDALSMDWGEIDKL